MNRKTDDLPMNKEVGLRFTSLRKRARLTQDGLVRLAGRVEEIADAHQQSYIDQALLRRLAEPVSALRAGLN